MKTILPAAVDKSAWNAPADRSVIGDRLLTINEVAGLTGLAVGTLYHFVSQKRIPVVRLSRRCIRFRLSSLESWFEQLAEDAVKDVR